MPDVGEKMFCWFPECRRVFKLTTDNDVKCWIDNDMKYHEYKVNGAGRPVCPVYGCILETMEEYYA
jgi:hypothetical protein